MENNSGKDQIKRSAAPSGKEKLKLAVAGDLEVKELRPLYNSVGRTQINGTVTFNDADTFSVVYPTPTPVIPGQIIGAYEDGNFTKFRTAQVNGGSSTVYLYYIDGDEGRQYYESPSGSGLPRTAINTEVINDDFLAMELRLVTVSDQPTIVIGTIIIEIDPEEA